MERNTHMEQDIRNLVQELEVRWKSLTIANGFVSGKVMLDEDLCKEVLEAILSADIEKIEYVGRQDAIDVTEDGHGVRLDVYVRDARGTVCSVEMQAIKDQLNVDKGRKLGLAEGRKLGLEEGRQLGLDEGHKLGLDEGRKIGLEEGQTVGEERLAKLVARLNEDGRQNDIVRAATDPTFRANLYSEYSIGSE